MLECSAPENCSDLFQGRNCNLSYQQVVFVQRAADGHPRLRFFPGGVLEEVDLTMNVALPECGPHLRVQSTSDSAWTSYSHSTSPPRHVACDSRKGVPVGGGRWGRCPGPSLGGLGKVYKSFIARSFCCMTNIFYCNCFLEQHWCFKSIKKWFC